MSKIICLIGKCATGKSTLEKELLKTGLFNPVVSMTTRPRRPGEIDGQSYNFVDDFTYDGLVGRGLVCCQTEYIVDGKRFRYGFDKNVLSEGKPNLIVLNPIGLKELAENPEFKDNLAIFMVEASLGVRIGRYLSREDLTDGRAYKRLVERLLQDEKDFDDVKDFCRQNSLKTWTCQNDGDYEDLQEIVNHICFCIE